MGDRDANVGPVEREQLEKFLATGADMLRQNRVSAARKAFADALKIDPDNVRVLGLVGLACFRMNDFAGALPVYQRLVSLSRYDASLALNLGLVHLKLGNAADAIRELQRSRELDPSQGRAVSYLGLAYARNGEYARAYQAFLQAGQTELAQEMEQYLSEAQRQDIRAGLAGRGPRARQGAHGGSADAPASILPAEAAPMAAALPAAPMGQVLQSAESVEFEEIGDGDVIVVEVAEPAAETEPGAEDTAPVAAAVEPAAAAPVATAGVAPAQAEATAAPAPARAGSAIQPTDGKVKRPARGVISQAVAQAGPAASATAGAARVAMGHKPPQALSEFATAQLIRPEDGDHTFETSAGGVLIVRVRGRVFTRTEGVSVSGGELAYEVASRRVRGSSTGEEFSGDGRQLFIVSGHGHLIASPLEEHFTAVTLDEDILYLREDLVYAFEEQLRWENGQVPGSGSALRMVQFRGQGAVAFRSRQPLLTIKLAPGRVLYIDAQVLAGWIGRVIPRAVAPAAGGGRSKLFVECTGEGVILIENEEEGGKPVAGGSKPAAGSGKPVAGKPAAGSGKPAAGSGQPVAGKPAAGAARRTDASTSAPGKP